MTEILSREVAELDFEWLRTVVREMKSPAVADRLVTLACETLSEAEESHEALRAKWQETLDRTMTLEQERDEWRNQLQSRAEDAETESRALRTENEELREAIACNRCIYYNDPDWDDLACEYGCLWFPMRNILNSPTISEQTDATEGRQ